MYFYVLLVHYVWAPWDSLSLTKTKTCHSSKLRIWQHFWEWLNASATATAIKSLDCDQIPALNCPQQLETSRGLPFPSPFDISILSFEGGPDWIHSKLVRTSYSWWTQTRDRLVPEAVWEMLSYDGTVSQPFAVINTVKPKILAAIASIGVAQLHTCHLRSCRDPQQLIKDQSLGEISAKN